jgi:hypothetical protein
MYMFYFNVLQFKHLLSIYETVAVYIQYFSMSSLASKIQPA